MTSRTKPGVAFWATVVVVVLLGYPLSFGPACWIVSHTHSDPKIIGRAYGPIARFLAGPCPAPVADIFWGYADSLTHPDYFWLGVEGDPEQMGFWKYE